MLTELLEATRGYAIAVAKGDRDLAEDALSDVVVVALERPELPWSAPYFKVCVKHRIYDLQDQQRCRRPLDFEYGKRQLAVDTTTTSISEHNSILDRLTTQQQEAAVCLASGCTYRQAGRVLGISKNTVGRRLEKAKRKLSRKSL